MRAKYLGIRNSFLTLNPSVTFLQEWCEEEGRSFKELDIILRQTVNHPFEGERLFRDLMIDLVRYFDKKYKINVLLNKDNEVIKTY